MKQFFTLLTATVFLLSCSNKFLEEIPNSNILTPKTTEDFQRLLDNTDVIGLNSALPQLAADEYYIISESAWLSSYTATERQSYIWEEDIYGGEVDIKDWNAPYESIFYANNVLNEIDKRTNGDIAVEMQDVYGQALFQRAKAYYDLLKNFSVPFDETTQHTDLGVPLRNDPSIDYTVGRSTVKECYDHIFNDLEQALKYLKHWGPMPERNRPTKLAANALLARIHLYRREYDKAEKYADNVLNQYDKLIDYNTISLTSSTPFNRTNDELIMYGAAVIYGNSGYLNRSETVFVDTTLIELYSEDDLRLSIYYNKVADKKYTMKVGYNGSGLTPFTGLAFDEVFLIKAECLVRKGKLDGAAVLMNRMLVNRYKTGTYQPINFRDQQMALDFVLNERRKELVWRCIRWDDIKRLNKEGANIVIKRVLSDKTYSLEPNSSRYTFNIPQDEINRSKIKQNNR